MKKNNFGYFKILFTLLLFSFKAYSYTTKEFYSSIEPHFYMFKISEADLLHQIGNASGIDQFKLISILLEMKRNKDSDESLNQSIRNLLNFYDLEKENRGSDFQNLSEIEVLAIRLYTGDDYRIINQTLRNQISEPIDLLVYINILDEALNKLPVYKGLTMRGTNLPDHIAELYQEGKIVSDRAYLSTSTSLQYPGKYQLRIQSKSGRWIDSISQNKGEGEVLFPRNTRFRVLKRTQIGEEVLIDMEELAQY